uniref:Synaptonemal complex central element protein 3 n=1 Tax=Oryzias latipes TaxID=8090 RepID=A0A3P9HEX7_ORYLA
THCSTNEQNSTDKMLYILTLELNKNLERMVEDTENMSAQLTWMAYDMVALRTNPEEGASMRQLEEAYQRCRLELNKNLERMVEDTENMSGKRTILFGWWWSSA